jgi:hypothetical protein
VLAEYGRAHWQALDEELALHRALAAEHDDLLSEFEDAMRGQEREALGEKLRVIDTVEVYAAVTPQPMMLSPAYGSASRWVCWLCGAKWKADHAKSCKGPPPKKED